MRTNRLRPKLLSRQASIDARCRFAASDSGAVAFNLTRRSSKPWLIDRGMRFALEDFRRGSNLFSWHMRAHASVACLPQRALNSSPKSPLFLWRGVLSTTSPHIREKPFLEVVEPLARPTHVGFEQTHLRHPLVFPRKPKTEPRARAIMFVHMRQGPTFGQSAQIRLHDEHLRNS